jgi:Ca2+:H+ antiporter
MNEKKDASTTRLRNNVRIPDEEEAVHSSNVTRTLFSLGKSNSPSVSSGRSANFTKAQKGFRLFLNRFLRKDKPKVGVVASLRAILLSSWVNVFFVVLPIAWAAHFSNVNNKEDIFSYPVTFTRMSSRTLVFALF